MKNLRRCIVVLMFMLTATSAWSALEGGSGAAAGRTEGESSPMVDAATGVEVPAELAQGVGTEFDRAMAKAAGLGETVEDVVRSLLERGFDLSEVVKSAIEGGGNLDGIFAGARAAGYSREVVAKEAMASGLPEGELLLALRSAELLGLNYTPGNERAAGFSALSPIQGSVGGNVRGRIVSPYRF